MRHKPLALCGLVTLLVPHPSALLGREWIPADTAPAEGACFEDRVSNEVLLDAKRA